MSDRKIKEWPENERPRERLIKYGAESLSDAQLLAIVLRTGGGGKGVLNLAMCLLDAAILLRAVMISPLRKDLSRPATLSA